MMATAMVLDVVMGTQTDRTTINITPILKSTESSLHHIFHYEIFHIRDNI
jgi:hypothetical protein